MALSILIQNQNMFWRLYMYFSFSFFRGSVTDGKMINGRICLWVQERFFCKSKCWDADSVENIFERSQLWLFVLNCHELIRICCLILWFSSRTCTSEGSNSSLWKQKNPCEENFKECKKDLWQCSPIGKGTTRLSKDASITASLFDEQLKLVVFARHPWLPPSTFFKLGEICCWWNGVSDV